MAQVQHKPLQHVRKKPAQMLIAVAVIFGIVWVQIPPCHGAATCATGQFACNDGSCILQEKMCDGRLDCSDNSDEADCDFKLCRKPNWFQCAKPHGPCLSAELVCNNIDNCPGGEDEHECPGRSGSRSGSISSDVGTGGWHSLQHNCTEFEYTCQSDQSCIPRAFVCDGKSHCNDGSDEVAGCMKAEANCSGFFCANKKCLESGRWTCDGVDDCGDASDERNCTAKCATEFGKFLCRDSLTCVDLAKACDGTSDCPDGSDESALCTSVKENCKTLPCPTAAKCQMHPKTGPVCVCPGGFRHSTLQNACVDINECQEQHGICSQVCENTSGGYRCACDADYAMRPDNRTCEAQGQEALLLYTTQVTVMGVHLRSQRVYTVARNLTKVIGVSYDGDDIFWTNIQNEEETIVRAKPDGSQQHILLTSGLDAPEDLAVDWLTGNIYFSDNVLRHIAVCSRDGHNCAILVTVDVHHPRAIALWPQRGQMFWTDWGKKPMIARSSMDGNSAMAIVSDDIHWPNGIALDMHNERIYWVDAKLASMESVRPDGTDRRIVLEEILKHPYGLAVFEDNIYWSDWGTRSVHTCNKFTGKGHKVIAKDRTIYAVHIYHSAKQPRTPHACMSARCSHLCLLAENNSSTCACPDGMVLSGDQQRCIKTHKKQRLFIGLRSALLEMEHTTFGRHTITQTHQLPTFISEMAYNNVNGTVIVADNMQHAIFEYDPSANKLSSLLRGNLGNVSAIAFDHLAHNVYWADAERHVVEVLSLRTRQRAIVSFFAGNEAPIGLAIVPEDGVMFVALRARRYIHIAQEALSGRGDHVHVFEDELGDDDIKFAPDYQTKTLYWADSDLGRISFSDYRNLHAYTFRGRQKRPYSLAIVDEDLFWSELKSGTIHWTHKSNLGPIKHIKVETTQNAYAHLVPSRIPLLASSVASIVDHPCQHANGGCSHICVTLSKFSGTCLCPAGLVFKDSTNRTCIETLDCEFRCRSGECLTLSRRCNGRKDCPDGSDEDTCQAADMKHPAVICSIGQFQCHNAEQCVESARRCDGQKNCHDGSDEIHCEKFDQFKRCHRHQHACDNGQCVDFSAMCDGVDDCGDNSDEASCKASMGKDANARPVCDANMFQCNSGTCIAKSWECDGKLDCTDGSDEHDKCELKDCPATMHKCVLGQCIEERLVCDGHNDCGDQSDEVNCDLATGRKRNTTCDHLGEQPMMYQCASNASICLPVAAKCNGTAECPRGEDEADCGAVCSIYEFQCRTNSECIRLEFRCDHDKDCADGSDEHNCDHVSHNGTTSMDAAATHERPCEAHMYDCKDGQCVDLARVCDGFADCETGVDEGPLCSTACRSGSSAKPVCAHKCRATPTGSICGCFGGYRLDADQRACDDINECAESDPCAQVCENTLGAFRCSCYADFMLRTDKTTCKSIESESTLLFSTYNEVRSMSEQPIVLRVAWSANDSKITGFDVNVRQRLAYFGTDNEDVLYALDMSSGQVVAALAVTMPTKVAVDWITDNVYVISRSQRYEIQSCSFPAKMCGRIVQASAHETIKALAVDAFNRRLFYVIIRSHAFNQPISQISIAHLDGQKREQLLAKRGGYVTALAVDPYKKQLYFVDMHTKTLQAISYRMAASRTPQTLVQKGNAVMHPSGLTVYENQAYIVNIGAKEATRCQLYGARTCKAFNLNILNAEDVVVDGASRQPLTRNPCAMAKCRGMCVQAEYGYECMCGDAIVDELTVCPKAASNEITSSVLLARASAGGAENAGSSHGSHTATIVTLSVLLVALIGAGVGYWYFRRVRQGHRDLNINLHFQNPLASIGKIKSRYGDSSAAAAATAASSFAAERDKLQLNTPIYRFFRGASAPSIDSGGDGNGDGDLGTEILLETSGDTNEVRAVGQNSRMSRRLVGDDAGYDPTRAHGRYDDDMHTRLVP